jgi:hypothetical protein
LNWKLPKKKIKFKKNKKLKINQINLLIQETLIKIKNKKIKKINLNLKNLQLKKKN